MKTISLLKSQSYNDIIECLLQSSDDSTQLNQKDWLLKVTNNGLDEFGKPNPNCPINWNNTKSISFAILNLAAAGRKLNVKKLEEEGIDDFIGTHFPKFKDSPDYSPYPKNYMNSPQITQPLNIEFNTQVIKPDIDPNKCFNEELLKQCIDADISIEPFLEGYGTLVHSEPKLIWIEEIHGLDPIESKDGKVTRPRGFQTRANEDYDRDTVEDLSDVIQKKKWNPKLLQGAVFELEGTEFEGQSISSRGVERKYGIANLTHRYYGAKDAGEEYIIAWVIKIPLSKLTKWATAVANLREYASNPRKDDDIINSIKQDMEAPDSELAQRINNAPEKLRRDLMGQEVDTYNVKAKTRNSIVRKLEQQDVYRVERKRHDSDTLKAYIQVHCVDYTKSKENNVDYVTDAGVEVYTAIAQGDNHLSIAKKIAINVASDKPSPMIVNFANDNSPSKTITIDNRAEERAKFPKEVKDSLKTFGIAYQKIFVDRTHTLPQFLALPEFGDEYEKLKDGEKFIDVSV